MLIITLVSYLVIRHYYDLGTVGLTITAAYSLHIITLSSTHFLLPRLLDTLIGCFIAFAGTLWLWPQWQSQLLHKNAYNTLEAEQQALRRLLSSNGSDNDISLQRLNVNQSHSTLVNSLNQAMKEPGFDARYLADLRLWVTHNQFIIENINAIFILASEHNLPNHHKLKQALNQCEFAIQLCQQRLEHNEINKIAWMSNINKQEENSVTSLENHVQRILSHLNVMYTISTQIWHRSYRR